MSKISYSVVLSVFNEAKHISQCLASLCTQTVNELEIIIIDDGSTDGTVATIHDFVNNNKSKRKISFYQLSHRGPGECRNFGAEKASGEILIFLDGDMFFSKNFIEKLVYPILTNKKIIGTDSQSEFLANPDNFWARCWSIGRFASVGNYTDEFKNSMVPNKKNHGGVFRAILKGKFNTVGGFDYGGDYSDDESLGKKLGVKATLANDAIFFHYNPDSLRDVWRSASWIGEDRKLNSGVNKYLNLVKFSLPASILKGLLIGRKVKYYPFMLFKLVFDTAIWVSVFLSL